MSLSIDEKNIQDYLKYGTVHAPETLINPIKMLSKSSLLIVNEDDLEIHNYFDIINESRKHQIYHNYNESL